MYSLVFILRQQTCTLLLPISLTISISCTLFQELYNRFLSVFTLQLKNPRNANKIFAIASHVMSHCLLIYPELGWWHICWGRLMDIVFWKSQCDGQTQNHAFFVRLKMLLLTERQRRQTSIKLTDDKYAKHASWTDSPLAQKKSSGKTTGIKHRPFIVIPGHFYTYNVLWI